MASRGSDELLTAWKKGSGIDEKLVRSIVEATRELEIQDVLIKGQPKPDFIRASAIAEDAERCGTVVTNLLGALTKGGSGNAPVIRVFPRGIPWPEQFIVDIAIGQSRGGS